MFHFTINEANYNNKFIDKQDKIHCENNLNIVIIIIFAHPYREHRIGR